MPYNFREWDREQLMLLPPSLADWLVEDHLAWFVLDAVDQLVLSEFFAARRADGWGRASYHPQMMVSLLVYAYCIGELSSRQIEKACRTDVAFRVICANQVPDHTTICRFRVDHEAALKGLFVQVLALCAQAGLAEVGTVALDGTKVAADAALSSNRTYQAICAEFERTVAGLLEQAAELDAEEDELYGPDRGGDELPDELADPTSRVARLAEAKRQLEAAQAERKAAYEQHLERRAEIEEQRGSKLRGRKPKDPGDVPDPDAKANVTDPDSRVMKNGKGHFVQGYNGQAIVNDRQVVLAAHLTRDANDVGQLHPMLDRLADTLQTAGVERQPDTVLADAGYCSEDNLTVADDDGYNGPDLLVATGKDRDLRAARDDDEPPPTDDEDLDGLTARQRMDRLLATDEARDCYAQRGWMIEPVFGQVKAPRGIRRFSRRGYSACDAEWHLILASHNLLKLWRHRQHCYDIANVNGTVSSGRCVRAA